ncbi:MAG: hypothetical protein KDJ52_16195 [Anaerolineae bacterium]|nr:hypothetical protein [Anaerolineae bacterium]
MFAIQSNRAQEQAAAETAAIPPTAIPPTDTPTSTVTPTATNTPEPTSTSTPVVSGETAAQEEPAQTEPPATEPPATVDETEPIEVTPTNTLVVEVVPPPTQDASVAVDTTAPPVESIPTSGGVLPQADRSSLLLIAAGFVVMLFVGGAIYRTR